jgi:hypothetical protein
MYAFISCCGNLNSFASKVKRNHFRKYTTFKNRPKMIDDQMDVPRRNWEFTNNILPIDELYGYSEHDQAEIRQARPWDRESVAARICFHVLAVHNTLKKCASVRWHC